MNDITWSKRLGVLIADALVDAGLISKSELSRAADIAAEEILVRLSMKDRPPQAADGSQKDF
jgi:hypothetical protein